MLRHWSNIRSEIDEIDRELAKLIARRTYLARSIGFAKQRAGLPVRDTDREMEVLEHACQCAEDLDSRRSILRIYKQILEESRRLQGSRMEIEIKNSGGTLR